MTKIVILIAYIITLVSCSSTKPTNNKDKELSLTANNSTTIFDSQYGVVLIPGVWQPLNYEKSSGQQYYQNTEGVIIAIAKMPKKSYSFYKPSQKNYETTKAFTRWET